jgi:hypothetical protein
MLLLAMALGCSKKAADKGSVPLIGAIPKMEESPGAEKRAMPVFIAGSPHQSDHLPFDWSVYSDPSRPEFWADGADGVLPRPFLQLAGEPTIENAKRLIEWQNAQWRAIENVIKALGGAEELDTYSELVGENFLDSLSRKDQSFQLARNSPLVRKVLADENQGDLAWEDVGIVYIYRSMCHACQQTKSVIEAAIELGAKVIPLQISDGGAPMFKTSQPYSKEWAEYFPLGEGEERVTPTFYIVVKGHEPRKTAGSLSLKDITDFVKSTLGDKA